MEKVPKNVLNPKLYLEVKKEIIKQYPKHGAYRSMMIVKKYKEKGGKYSGVKEKNKTTTTDWRAEEWINVYAYLKEGKKVPCGDKSYINKSACRPLKRINDKTPETIGELVKKHGKKKILEAIEKKNKDPQNLILRWSTLSVIKKKK